LDIDPGGIVVILAKKQEKIWKKIFPKEKKGKKPRGGSKIRNKLCIKNEVFHVYTLNKILSCTKCTRSIVLIDCKLTELFE
jgi:hypothetical protein